MPRGTSAPDGQDLPDQPRIAAADLITDADAQWVFALAERSFASAHDFVQAWLAAGGKE